MEVNSSKPRIMIGVPCYGQVDPAILEDWMRFMYHCGRRMPQYDFLLGIKTKTEQFRARNAIVDAALQMDCEWLLMLDDDMVINAEVTQIPTEDYSFIEKLIAHDKDICGALYYQRNGECSPVLMKKMTEKGYRFLRDDEIEHRLQRVDVAGGGCLLIKVRVFDRLQHPYFEPEYRFGTDIQLCRKASEKGFEVWADTSIELGHIRTEKVIVTSRNRLQFQMRDQIPGEARKTFIASDVYSRLLDDAESYTGKDLDAMQRGAMTFIQNKRTADIGDAEWYRLYPDERIWRQVIFNTQREEKRTMTEFILASIDNAKKLSILDFGCGIGVTAFHLAEKGHSVSACDIRGTGTLDFLKWRSKKHGVPVAFWESDGGVPALHGSSYDIIIAMDCIEHIEEWRWTLTELAKHLKPGGLLFANNGILDDDQHPEHYAVDNKEFIRACIDCDLMPVNQITYVKKETKHAENANSRPDAAVQPVA